MDDYGSDIFWLQTAPDTAEPALNESITADVAIVGGGFTGLWTAYELKRAEPNLDIVIIEANEVAHGASGRNGGFAMTLLDMSLAHLVRNYGVEAAKAAHEAVAESVDEIGRVCAEHEIACDYHKGGLLVVATNDAQERRIDQDLEAAEKLGFSDFEPLTGERCRELVNSPTYRSGYLEPACAIVNPAQLARGLKRLVMSLGVRLYEDTPAVLAKENDAGKVQVQTEGGDITADHVVLTTNAWTRHFPDFRRKVIPLYTYIVLTEPLSEEQWAEIGWKGRQGIEDKRNYVHYYRPTADGRILWGGSDGIIYRNLAIRPKLDRNEKVFDQLEATFRATFPQAADVSFSHRWGGPVAITIPFVPYFGTLTGGKIHYGFGYNGHGVAPAHTGGVLLRDLVLGRETDHTDLLFVRDDEKIFPPQPILWLGAAITRKLLLKQDRNMDHGRNVGDMDPFLLRLMNKLS